MSQQDVISRIRRRATSDSNPHRHQSFRAIGIIGCLRICGMVEVARQMANDESASTIGLYDWRDDQISLDEVERVVV